MRTRRQLRRLFRVNVSNHVIVRVTGRPPLEFIHESICPECGVLLGPHGEGSCRYFENLTLDQLAEKGYARYVEQL